MFSYCNNAKWGVGFDLKKFYYEIQINEEYEKYFGFMYIMEEGLKASYFVWQCLPYGYTRAPFIAKSILRPLVKKWRSLDICIAVFVDDGMAVSDDPVRLKKQSLQIQCDLLRTGFIPGIEKCFWTPTQQINWLGMKWDLSLGLVSILDRRIMNCQNQRDYLQSKWPDVSYRDISKFIGQIVSMLPVLEERGQLRTRYLQMIVNVRHFLDCSWDKLISYNRDLLDRAKSELIFWKDNLTLINCRKFQTPPPNVIGWVDAGARAGGGILGMLKPIAVGKYRPVTADNLLLPVSGSMKGLATLWDGAQWQTSKVCQSLKQAQPVIRDVHDFDPKLFQEVKHMHVNFYSFSIAADSNEREMFTGRELLLGCKDLVKGSNIVLHFDNMNAATIFSKGSPKHRLHKYALEMDELALKWDFRLNPVWIPRDLNKFSDVMSKCLDYDDYSVKSDFFEVVCNLFNVKCNYDRFANNTNTKTLLFNSSSFCLGTAGVDSFNYSWGNDSINWIFSPPRLIIRAINHLRDSKGVGLVLTPEWKGASFHPYLNAQWLKPFIRNKRFFDGQNIFLRGVDKTSYFGPDFQCRVIVWHFDFKRY